MVNPEVQKDMTSSRESRFSSVPPVSPAPRRSKRVESRASLHALDSTTIMDDHESSNPVDAELPSPLPAISEMDDIEMEDDDIRPHTPMEDIESGSSVSIQIPTGAFVFSNCPSLFYAYMLYSRSLCKRQPSSCL